MKVGDLVKYESWHTALQNLTGLVVEVSQSYDGAGDRRARVLWPDSRPTPIRWDWVEELRVVNESR